jgi:outer membrane immunogenic protein
MKTIVSALALGATLVGANALAADLPSRKAPVDLPAPPVPTWTGLYAGVNTGASWNARNESGGNASVLGGGQIGYNLPISPLSG